MAHSYIRSKEIIDYIDNLIYNDGFTSYDKLHEAEKDKLCALAMQALGNDRYMALMEVSDLDITLDDMMRFLLCGSTDNALQLACTIRTNAHRFFRSILADLFEEKVHESTAERYREHGLVPIIDKVNGEVRWIR